MKKGLSLPHVQESGIGLLELTLALAIIAVLLLMATRYYQMARFSQQINEGIDVIQSVHGAAERWHAINDNYADISLQALVDRDFLPAMADQRESPANPWGGGITVQST